MRKNEISIKESAEESRRRMREGGGGGGGGVESGVTCMRRMVMRAPSMGLGKDAMRCDAMESS